MAEYAMLHAGNSEAQEKVALSRLFAQAGTLAAPGVLGGLVVAQAATANGTVLIAPGSAVCHPSMTVGASLLVCDSTKTLDIFTANPMGGLPRNDVVVFDSLTATIIAITGTPNATPTDPTVPNTAVALARLRHAASATTIPTAEIDTLIVPATLRGVPNRTRGSVTSATTDANGVITVTHGLGVTPAIIMTNVNGILSSNERTLRISARSATTFSVMCFYNSTVVATSAGWSFDWIAEA